MSQLKIRVLGLQLRCPPFTVCQVKFLLHNPKRLWQQYPMISSYSLIASKSYYNMLHSGPKD